MAEFKIRVMNSSRQVWWPAVEATDEKRAIELAIEKATREFGGFWHYEPEKVVMCRKCGEVIGRWK